MVLIKLLEKVEVWVVSPCHQIHPIGLQVLRVVAILDLEVEVSEQGKGGRQVVDYLLRVI